MERLDPARCFLIRYYDSEHYQETIQTWFAGSQILKEYILSKEQLCIARGTHQTTATGNIGGTKAYTAIYQLNATPIPPTASLVYTTRR